MAILKFNNVDVTPDPSSVECTIQDISTADSGRSSQTGQMWKNVVRQVRTLKLSWNNIQLSEARQIIAQLKSGSPSQYVSVTYDGDPQLAGTITKTFYYGDISTSFAEVWIPGRKRYSKFSFDLIER